MYASIFLVIAAGAILVIFGPVYDDVGRQQIEDRRADVLREVDRGGVEFPETARVAANRFFDVGLSVIDDFAGGISDQARNLFVIGLLLLAAGVFWASITGVANRIWPNRQAELKKWE